MKDCAYSWSYKQLLCIAEVDYPPKANAGSNRVISLPENSIVLFGNSSTDDKGIESYEWVQTGAEKVSGDVSVTPPLPQFVYIQLSCFVSFRVVIQLSSN